MKFHTVWMLPFVFLTSGAALADSSSKRLAGYYDRQMAIVAGSVYAWEGQESPTRLFGHGAAGRCRA
jgi:hypothetical protein